MPRHDAIDLEYASLKTVPTFRNLVAGNAFLTFDPAVLGRYVVTDVSDGNRLLGYLETDTVQLGRISVSRLSRGLDKLLKPQTVKC